MLVQEAQDELLPLAGALPRHDLDQLSIRLYRRVDHRAEGATNISTPVADVVQVEPELQEVVPEPVDTVKTQRQTGFVQIRCW